MSNVVTDMSERKTSLLDRARGDRANDPMVAHEELELVMAYLREEVTISQISRVLKMKAPTQAYPWILVVIRRAVASGQVTFSAAEPR